MSKKIYLQSAFAYREDTLENWLFYNPILERGEVSIVRDGDNGEWLKIGDGVTRWVNLPYKKGPQGIPGPAGEPGPAGDDYVLTQADKEEIANMAKPPIDQIYNPESENAQSGVAVAEALANAGGGKGTLTTICDITLTEEVNSVICADTNSFADISKVQDFYMYIEIPKHEIKHNGNIQIRLNDGYVFGVIGNFDNSYSYTVNWSGYSINIPNTSRFNLIPKQFMTNHFSDSLSVNSTSSVIRVPLEKIHIAITSEGTLPIGTNIKIVGWVK